MSSEQKQNLLEAKMCLMDDVKQHCLCTAFMTDNCKYVNFQQNVLLYLL